MESRNLPRRPALLAALVLGTGALALGGCGSGSTGAGSGRPVVASTAPQLDGLVRELSGGGVEVAAIVAATADVHELELRPSQVRALKQADLVLRPGRGNDAWAQEALDQLDVRKVDVSATLPGTQRHWWMDPSLAETAAKQIAVELDRLDPAGAAARATALAGVVGDLQAVDRETKRCLATVPVANRLIVTDHDAAGAYAERYGLTVVGTISPGADPEAAPSAQRIVELAQTMRRRHVKAVFPIAPHGSALAKTVAQRGGATLGAPLWADALPAADAGTTASGHGALRSTLTHAAHLNGESVAKALGAKPGACSDVLPR